MNLMKIIASLQVTQYTKQSAKLVTNTVFDSTFYMHLIEDNKVK